MVEISYKKNIQVNESDEVVVCYNLTSDGNQYNVECYVENAGEKNRKTYNEIKGFTKDRETGVKFLKMIAEGEVLPIHLKDILEDYFAY